MEALLRKHYSVALSCLLILTATGVLVWRFGSGMEKRQTRVVEVRDRIASFELNRKVLADESEELDAIKTKVDSLEQYLVTDETIPDLLSNVEALATEHKVGFSISSVQTPRSGESKKLIIDFTAEGSLQHVESFLHSFLSQPYQIRFQRFNLYKLERAESVVAEDALAKPSTPTVQGWKLVAGVEVLSY